MIKKIKIDYDFSVFLNADYEFNSYSCISQIQADLPKLYDKYGGFPDSYSLHNTNINQIWWDVENVDVSPLESQLNMEILTISTIRQRPGNILPIHKDTFYQIKKRYPGETRTKVRANVHLEDWKIGHLIQYNDNETWSTYINWKQGEGLLWDETVEHIGANIGLNDKYTLQISGFLNE